LTKASPALFTAVTCAVVSKAAGGRPNLCGLLIW
jgi:hypothetical protein